MKHIILLGIFLMMVLVFGNLKKNIERFENEEDIPYIEGEKPILIANMRPCQVYLTNEPSKCDELSEMYKMGKIQLRVLINTLKKIENYQDIVKHLEIIYDDKEKTSSKSCKLTFRGLEEVRNTAESGQYEYKTITKATNYNLETMNGYCLMEVEPDLHESPMDIAKGKIQKRFKDVVDESSVTIIKNINGSDDGNKIYAAMKLKDNIPTTLGKSTACPKPNVDLEDGARFLKMNCDIEKATKLVVYRVDIVKFNKKSGKFDIIDIHTGKITAPTPNDTPVPSASNEETTDTAPVADAASPAPTSLAAIIAAKAPKPPNKIDTKKLAKEFNEKFFRIQYVENGPIALLPLTVETPIYVFTFDPCENLEKYKKIEYVFDKDKDEDVKLQFSMDELKVFGKTIRSRLPLPFKPDTKNILESDDEDAKKITDNVDNDITDLLNDKIDNAESENKAAEEKIKEYDLQLQSLSDSYKELESLCQDNDNPEECLKASNTNIAKMHSLISMMKTELEDSIKKNIDLKHLCIDVKVEMSKISIQIQDINLAIDETIPRNNQGQRKSRGINISYKKYSNMVSNDDCIYVQF